MRAITDSTTRRAAISRYVRALLAMATFACTTGTTAAQSLFPERRAPAVTQPAAPESRPDAPARQPPTTQTAPADARRGEFQPGVVIDWRAREVRARARVVLREGPLEFFACFAGKEHESILRLEGSAASLYAALGLIGLSPGRPPEWSEPRQGYSPPSGDLVDLDVAWRDESVERRVSAWEWIREREYDRLARPRPWVFAGSRVLADQSVSADHSGAGVALVDFDDSLIALSQELASRDADLWALAETAAIPPLDTRVELVVRAARPARISVEVDRRGDLRLNGRVEPFEAVLDALRLAHQLAPAEQLEIRTDGALRADAAQLRQRLLSAGVPPECLRWTGERERTKVFEPTTTKPGRR
ncbi:MAG: YdjY domain-containing protein [Phycisphaerae bacterium]